MSRQTTAKTHRTPWMRIHRMQDREMPLIRRAQARHEDSPVEDLERALRWAISKKVQVNKQAQDRGRGRRLMRLAVGT